MPSKKQKSKRVEEEERNPKHVNVRLSYRDYLKLVAVADVASVIKENKEVKKLLTATIASIDEGITADRFLGLIAGLPTKGEKSIERYRAQPPREAPTRMYFTDPEKCTKEVTELYSATKKYIPKEKPLRYDQKRETCPTDVRVMFYAYVRGKGLIEDGNPDITVDKLLKSIAPNTLSKVKRIKRNNSSLVWEICSEIRGSKPKGKKKPKVKEIEEEEDESEEESEEEPPKRKGRRKPIVESSDEESSEESSEEEVPKSKSKRR